MTESRKIRWSDRQVTDTKQINEIIEKMDAIRIGFYDGEEVYVVPLSFGYTEENGDYTFYMHGGGKGRKADLVRNTGKAGFELDKAIEVMSAAEPCNHTQTYNSVIGHGTIEEITDRQGKIDGLNIIMKQNTGKGDWEFPDKMIDATFVMKLTADWLTCKIHTDKI